MSDKNIFSAFTNLYSLTKTLRFELKPVGTTLNKMYEQLGKEEHGEFKEFFHDHEIEQAYQTLKPHLDKLHEEFITNSLESEDAKKIRFEEYLEEYKKAEKELTEFEKTLRSKINKLFDNTGARWKVEVYPQYEWKKGSSFNILLTKNAVYLVGDKNADNAKIKNAVLKIAGQNKKAKKGDDINNEDKENGFYGYLSGYNQNRANYYVTEKEASTALATRIVHENLPKFCDNHIQFEGYIKQNKKGENIEYNKKAEYLSIYKHLKDYNITTQIKDSETDTMIELYPISEEIFDISYFTYCLSQNGIEAYNKKIGHYNSLINLYNQAKLSKQKDFKKLNHFKTLFKQIGCGKKDPLFFKLTHDTIKQAGENKENYEKSYSLEQIFINYSQAVKLYFNESVVEENGVKQVKTILDLKNYILEKEDYKDVFWSKQALNTISNNYFANWYDLAKKLNGIDKKSFSEDKNSGEIKIPQVVQLSQLFDALDLSEGDDWKKPEDSVLFKSSLFTKTSPQFEKIKSDRKRKILEQGKIKPSQALLQFIFADIDILIEEIYSEENEILNIDYKKFEDNQEYKEKTKEKIKLWLDKIKMVLQIIKYFSVSESKVKKDSLDTIVANTLKNIIEESSLDNEQKNDIEWFKWYDAVRNYLTKKPQDEAKDNKLKLNFLNSTLLDGWDVNMEKSNYSVILQDKNGKQYLAITRKDKNTIFEKKFEIGRGKNKQVLKNELYNVVDENFWYKMEYDFWSDASKMIPKCSTQINDVKAHFKTSNEGFKFPVGYEVRSGEKFTEEAIITKEVFELNNKVYKKDDISISEMRYNLTKEEEKKYIKSFQKEYWNLLVKTEGKITKEQLDKKWKEFCNKKYSDLTVNEKKYKDSLSKWIDFCRYFVTKYPKTKLFNYNFKPTSEYNTLDEFYHDLDLFSYKLNLNTTVNKEKLDQLIAEGEIYLFEIKNQDSNERKSENHKNNLETIYWKAIFSNLENRPKLNGRAEIFYRKRVDNLYKKKDKNGKEIYENYRFIRNEWGKFIFHIPITLNFCLNDLGLDDKINNNFSQNPYTYYLGIDRGEKHLVYYCLINQNAEIVKQGSLNLNFTDKNGDPRTVKAIKKITNEDGSFSNQEIECSNYNELLEARAGNRDFARKNWQAIDSIKNLKEGYISQVVRKIADLAVNLNDPKPTYIILEDLNTGFKRGRQKIEKQVYQKFELALAKKLNFLVDKTKASGLGSVTEAIQLTPPVTNYSDIENRKQVGVMLYTRANYTSQTDPATGWRKSIYVQRGSEDYIKAQIIGGKYNNNDKELNPAFSDIYWESGNYVFVYTEKNISKTWKMYSGKNGKSLDRFRGKRGDKNEWKNVKVDINEILNRVFEKFDKQYNILDQIHDKTELLGFQDMKPWDSLRFAIDLIQQIRNTGEKDNKGDEDFIYSPVRDENGNHFDSREYLNKISRHDVNAEVVENLSLPVCGDANGAFNIARKGLITNEHINRWIENGRVKSKEKSDLNLFVSEEEWGLWLNNREKWVEMLNIFSSQKQFEKYKNDKKDNK